MTGALQKYHSDALSEIGPLRRHRRMTESDPKRTSVGILLGCRLGGRLDMLTASRRKNVAASATFLFVGAFALTLESVAAQAQSPSKPDMKARIDGLLPELERYLQDAMAKGHI